MGAEVIGRDIYFKESLDSTQNFIQDLGRQGFREGAVVVACRQTKGRGCRGRSWASPPGGVYFSCLLRPKAILLRNVSWLSLVAALACLEAVAKISRLKLRVKWPNDIFLAGKKLGGALCEVDACAQKINFAAVGIGLNVNTTELPPEATSLFLHTGKNFSENLIIQEVLGQIEKYYLKMEKGKSRELMNQWQKYCFFKGSRLKVKTLGRKVKGKACGIDREGRLLLRLDDGRVEAISGGDIKKIS